MLENREMDHPAKEPPTTPQPASSSSSSWRDTLYLYDGSFRVPEQNRVVWEGSIIPVYHCADARSAPLPNPNYQFDESTRSMFHWEGLITSGSPPAPRIDPCPAPHDNMALFLQGFRESLASPEWTFWNWPDLQVSMMARHDDEDDNGGSSGETAKRSSSEPPEDCSIHKVYFSTARFHRRLVVGMGKATDSQQGGGPCSFLEVGWLESPNYDPDDLDAPPARCMRLLLARRYLDDNDARVHWTPTLLRSHILTGLPPILKNEDLWSHVLDFVGPEDSLMDVSSCPPWRRSLALHSKIPWRHLAYHQHNGGGYIEKLESFVLQPWLCNDQEPPPLQMMPFGGGEDQIVPFRLSLSGFTPNAANTTWEGQCWGCGGPGVRKELSFNLVLCEPGEHIWSFQYGQFCSEECVLRAVPEIARCSAQWREENRGVWRTHDEPREDDICLEHDGTSYHSKFWDCLVQDGKGALQQMCSAGWEKETYEAEDFDEAFEVDTTWLLRPRTPDPL